MLGKGLVILLGRGSFILIAVTLTIVSCIVHVQGEP